MTVHLPTTLAEALDIRRAEPEAVPIAGGTDVMVATNFGRPPGERFIDLTRIDELARVEQDESSWRIGAGVTYATLLRAVPDLPALQQASRTVGSPQIRNRGTIGGNLGTASPAGDTLPVLAVYEADVELQGADGRIRRLPLLDFVTGPKVTCLGPDELITAVVFPRRRSVETYAKVGPRNAMVISVVGLALRLDLAERRARVAVGSVGPTVLRAPAAEALAEGLSDDIWAGARQPDHETLAEFGAAVAEAARPIDDVRGTAAYRRHACAVLGRRALRWALGELAARRRAAP